MASALRGDDEPSMADACGLDPDVVRALARAVSASTEGAWRLLGVGIEEAVAFAELRTPEGIIALEMSAVREGERYFAIIGGVGFSYRRREGALVPSGDTLRRLELVLQRAVHPARQAAEYAINRNRYVYAHPSDARDENLTEAGASELGRAFAFEPSAVEQFRRTGFLVVRQAVDPGALRPFAEHVRNVAEKHAEPRAEPAQRDTYANAFIQVFNAWSFNARVRELVFAPLFARMAAELMGVEAVRLFCDEVLFKTAGSGHTPWHQDLSACPMQPNDGITLWLPLCDVTERMGLMYLVEGSHALRDPGPYDISDETQEAYSKLISEHGLTEVATGPMRVGDLSFHDGWTIHGAKPNVSTVTREVLVVHYFPDGTRVGALDNPSRERLLNWVAPELRPGDLARCNAWPFVPASPRADSAVPVKFDAR